MKRADRKTRSLLLKISYFLSLFFITITLCSCEEMNTEEIREDTSITTSESITVNIETDKATNKKKTSSKKKSTKKKSAKKFTYKDIPAYSGNAYTEINNNTPFFTEDEITTDVFEKYSDLDDLGRCHVAFANICTELIPTEERGPIGHIKPSGWHTIKYPELIEDNYLYNRCHLIAHCLAGENDNEKNLITGTRYMNEDGMEPFELKVLDYIRYENNDAHVLYRVTPIYKKKNLVARGVLMEALSVEDNGEGIKFCVFVYNVQPHITIDYATGDSTPDKEVETENSNDEIIDRSMPSDELTYILNTNTHRFHIPGCRSVSQMSERNKEEYHGTREELINKGYSPCGNCHP